MAHRNVCNKLNVLFLIYRYMQTRSDKIPRKKLQLVGVTAMFIAAKYEEMYAPEIGKKL